MFINLIIYFTGFVSALNIDTVKSYFSTCRTKYVLHWTRSQGQSDKGIPSHISVSL